MDAYRNIELAKALSQLEILGQIDDLKNKIDAMRPLPRESEARIMQKLRLDWNYHSNAIEGNPYTYGETVVFLMEGLTAKGKTLKDHLDIKGHDEAIEYLLSIVKDKDYHLNEAEIRNLHRLLLKEPYFTTAKTLDGLPTRKEIQLGSYKSTPNHVETPTGTIHYYATVEETPLKMGELVAWLNEVSDNPAIHPVVIAALFHHQFTAIHPFDDGNGRMARLMMNLILMQKGYPPVVIKQEDRNNYYRVLRMADIGEYQGFVEYISNALVHTMTIYRRGAIGEPIHDVDDIDKMIALFKKGLPIVSNQANKDAEVTIARLKDSVLPFFSSINEKASQLEPLFSSVSKWIWISRNHTDFDADANKILLTGDSAIEMPEFVYESIDSVLKLTYEISFESFKNSLTPFGIKFEVSVFFGEHSYDLSYLNVDLLLKKPYGQALNQDEIQSVVKDNIEFLLKMIKKGV